MAQVVRQEDGSFVALTDDGRRVPLPADYLSRTIPDTVSNEQGVTAGERFYIKNFAGNEQAAMDFLSSHGYEVRKWGNHPVKMQFAVRKNPADPWRVVDPDGFEPQDLLDLVADVGMGVAITAATAATGGLGAGILAGAAAGGGAEALRQGIGAATGLGSENIDPSQIASQAVGGAVAEPIGRAVGAVTGSISKAALDMAERISGVRAAAGMSGDEAIRIAASRKPGLFSRPRLPSFQDVAESLFKKLKGPGGVFTDQFPETTQLNELFAKADAADIGFDASPVIAKFEDMLPEVGAAVPKTVEKRIITETEAAGTSASRVRATTTNMAAKNPEANYSDIIKEAELSGPGGEEGSTASRLRDVTTRRTTFENPEQPKSLSVASGIMRGDINAGQVREHLDRIMQVLQAAADAEGKPLDINKVSASTMNILRQNFQSLSRQQRLFDVPLSQGLKRTLRDSSVEIRRSLLQGLQQAGGDYRDSARLMRILDQKTRVWSAFQKALKTPDDLRNYIEKVYGKYNSRQLRMVGDLNKYFGVDVLPDIRAAQAGALVSKKGATPGTLSAFPSGGYRGGVAGLAGFTIAGPVGILPAIGLSSPKAVVAATYMGQQAAKVVSTPAATQTIRAAGIQALQESARLVGKGMAREPQGTSRRKVVIGY